MNDHSGICGWRDVCFPGGYTNVWRVYLVGGRSLPGTLDYLKIWPIIRNLSLPVSKPHQKSINPKDGVKFILASITNKSHQVNFISLHGPCFIGYVYNETGWLMLNVHLSYKPPVVRGYYFGLGGIICSSVVWKVQCSDRSRRGLT